MGIMVWCPQTFNNIIYLCNYVSFFWISVFSVPEEKYLTLEGFHKFTIDRAKQDIRSVWRAILTCGYDLHFERLAKTLPV